MTSARFPFLSDPVRSASPSALAPERFGGLEVYQQLEPSGLCTPSQSPYSPPAVALLAYQRIAPGWNGSRVLRVKLAGTVSAAAWLACISSSLPEKTASAIAVTRSSGKELRATAKL